MGLISRVSSRTYRKNIHTHPPSIMPKGGGGRGVRMKMPNMSNGALQASLAKMQADAAKQQDLLVEEKAEHSGVVTNVAPTINSQTGAQQNYPSWFNGDQRHRSMVIYPIYIVQRSRWRRGGGCL